VLGTVLLILLGAVLLIVLGTVLIREYSPAEGVQYF
jgi:hypothetical protein